MGAVEERDKNRRGPTSEARGCGGAVSPSNLKTKVRPWPSQVELSPHNSGPVGLRHSTLMLLLLLLLTTTVFMVLSS